MSEILERLARRGLIDGLDLELGRFLANLCEDGGAELALGSALLSRAIADGDVCLELSRYAGQLLLEAEDDHDPVVLPSLADWRRALRASSVVGEPEERRPLILESGDRLYLYRYWDYENQLAADLRQRAGNRPPVNEARLADGLRRLFPPRDHADGQKLAATLAVLGGFCVISGGPGTGKTTTLARVLALLIEQSEKPPRIRLAAPTGKAAVRMQEAIRASKAWLIGKVQPEVLTAIPEQASTLHRLLGMRPDGVYFRHDRENPLGLDVLVIDEASMVDLALMTKTVRALPPGARLILLGDKDQLSAVEAGAVLGELCAGAGRYSPRFGERLRRLTGEAGVAAAAEPDPVRDCIALLSHSYRFGARSGIGQLAGLVNRADSRGVEAMRRDEFSDIAWQAPPGDDEMNDLLGRMLDGYHGYLRTVRRRGVPVDEAFAAFEGFQVLCPQRRGSWGVENLNLRFETMIKARWRLYGQEWYVGRPVMVTRNDYSTRLFNGDIGIVLLEPGSSDRLRAYFREPESGLRSVALTRLPAHEPVFAMTVHKSQGSEFDRVLLVMPDDESCVMTRELAYTGITRAKRRLDLWGNPALLSRAVRRPVQRASGLALKLK
jgi:exodeoxyribonuclease V alpha subunit